LTAVQNAYGVQGTRI